MLKKRINIILIILAISISFFSVTNSYSSDLSDARTLRERCEREISLLEVSVRNFGDNSNITEFEKGQKLVKLGNVKFIQTKYTEAIEKYNEYLKLQFSLYEKIAKKYINRSGVIIDEIAEDLVDFIDNKKIVEYLRLANQNLNDAKSALGTKHYKGIVDRCRTAKNYAISAYKLAGKKIPDQYKKDSADNEGKILK